MTKTLYKSDWYTTFFESLDRLDNPIKIPEDPQLILDLEPNKHIHRWYDDDGEKGMGLYCDCGAFRELSFLDPWEGKTYQEIYEIMQKDRHLKN